MDNYGLRIQKPIVDANSIPGIDIDFAANGFICRVGCKTFVFGSLSVLMDNLHAYLEKPQEVMQSYLKNDSLPVNK